MLAGECPRDESNVRTWFRKPLLYPLSYGGGDVEKVVENRPASFVPLVAQVYSDTRDR
jgi:hypothetical protein